MMRLVYTIRWYIGTFLILFCLIMIAIVSKRFDDWLGGRFATTKNFVTQPAHTTSLPSATDVSPWATSLVTKDPRVQISQANSLLSEASNYGREALKEILTWQSEIEPLRNRELIEGATEEDGLFDKLAYVVREERMGANELRDASLRIDSWRLKLDELSKQQDPPALTADEMAEISELHSQCKTANESWQLAVQRAFAITRMVIPPAASSSAAEAPPTLEAKITEANAKATLAELEDEIEHTRVLRAEEREHEAELKRQAELKAKQAAELLEKVNSPEVQAILAPFLALRAVQPSMSGAAIRLKSVMEAQPMSLSALQSLNALSDSEAGYKRLAGIGGHRKLTEPKWSIHSQPNNWSESDREMLTEAQQVLRDYGPILVEAGLLSK